MEKKRIFSHTQVGNGNGYSAKSLKPSALTFIENHLKYDPDLKNISREKFELEENFFTENNLSYLKITIFLKE